MGMMIFMQRIFIILLTVILSQSVLNTAFAQPLSAPMQTQQTSSGLKYQIIKKSSGHKPKIDDEVEIRFTSYNDKGEVLEGTLNHVPVLLPVSEMFKGLQESLLLMPVGSIYEFDIPAYLGYSEEGKNFKQAVKYRIELLHIHS